MTQLGVFTVAAIKQTLNGIRFDNAAIDLLAVDGELAPKQRQERQIHREDANCVRVDLSCRVDCDSPSLARAVLADHLEEMNLWPARFLRPKELGHTFELWQALRLVTLERVVKSHPAAFNAYVSDAIRLRMARKFITRK